MPGATVALLPARGEAGGFSRFGVKYKALVPLGGRPLIDYVLRSLQASEIERIFIIQSPDEALERAVTPSPKNVFVDFEGHSASLAGSVVRGAEAILDCYGDRTRELSIMVAPCDIPLAQPGDFDGIIRQNLASGADVCGTAVANNALRERCPERRFHSLFFKDLGEVYTLQSIMFCRGGLIGYQDQPGGRRLTVFDRDGNPIEGLEEMVDSLRRHRGGFFIMPLFVYQIFVRRLADRGCLGLGLKLVADMLRRRLTVTELEVLLYRALNLKFVMLDTGAASISLDVDSPEDLRLFHGLAGDENNEIPAQELK